MNQNSILKPIRNENDLNLYSSFLNSDKKNENTKNMEFYKSFKSLLSSMIGQNVNIVFCASPNISKSGKLIFVGEDYIILSNKNWKSQLYCSINKICLISKTV